MAKAGLTPATQIKVSGYSGMALAHSRGTSCAAPRCVPRITVVVIRSAPKREIQCCDILVRLLSPPITGTIRDIPTEVFLSKDDGIPRDCAVNCDHPQTVSKRKIDPIITSLPPKKMADVGQAIRFAFDI